MIRRAFTSATGLGRGTRQPSGMCSAMQLLAARGFSPATIIDVGAADGGWSRLARKIFPTADLVLFEPQAVHLPALEKFESRNPDARIVRSAIGGADGSTLFDAEDPWGGVLQQQRTTSSITVPVVTLDAALAEAKPPFLVKLDTHGVEAEILGGARETLKRSVAWIIEAYNQKIARDCLLFWELCHYMAERGFRPIDLVDVHHRPHDESLWQMDLVFVRAEWGGFDYLLYT